MTFSNSYACGLQPPAVLYNNSQLKNLTLKNLAIYPSNFTTEASQGATLNWANLNFQPIGEPNKRVWRLHQPEIRPDHLYDRDALQHPV